MKYFTILYITLTISFSVTFMSCSKDLMLSESRNNPHEIFDEFWKYVDEHYIYFEEKQVDWDDVYKRYTRLIHDDISEDDLFYLCRKALFELKDGHNRIQSPTIASSNYDIRTGYEIHFSRKLVRDNYTNGVFHQEGNILYNMMDHDIGYIHIAAMSHFGAFNSIVRKMKEDGAKGLIIDVRHNSGGDSNPVPEMIADFIQEPTLLGYYVEKSGPGHDDVTEPLETISLPSGDFIFDLPVVVLINRISFSAASYFASMFQELENVTVVGQQSGGGGGGNYGYQLSNQWIVAVSVSDFLNTKMKSIESGVIPDIEIENTAADLAAGIDAMLERAILEVQR